MYMYLQCPHFPHPPNELAIIVIKFMQLHNNLLLLLSHIVLGFRAHWR